MTGPTTDSALAAVLAVCSAGCFGLASALQHSAASAAAPRSATDLGLLASLARRPVWLLGIVADVAAVLLQALALRAGAVTLVQPLLVAGLPVAVLLSAVLARRRLQRRERSGLTLCTVGLALLGPATATTSRGLLPSRTGATAAAVLVAVLVAGLLVLAARAPRHAPPALGTAAGVTIGAASVLLAVCAGRAADPVALLHSAAPYATVGAGLLGLLLSQAAFQTGMLGAPLAALSVVEPVTAVALAVAVLHEQLPTAPAQVAGAVLGTLLAVAGVTALTRPEPAAP